VVPKKKARPAKPSPALGKTNPFGGAKPDEEPLELELIEEAEAAPLPKQAEPAKKPAAKKTPKPPVEDENPFDFS
jgi:hypothetical protein